MKKALTIVILVSLLLSISLAEAQVPSPPDVPTLGPSLTIVSSGNDYTNVKITTPINQTNYSGELILIITVEAVGLLGQFGNVGYSIDGGTIYSIRNLAKSVDDKTGYPEQYWYKTTAKASLTLPNLSDGFHTITVYYGWQYPAYLEVSAYTTIDFSIGNAHATPEIFIKSPSNLSITNSNSTLLSFFLRQIQPLATSASIFYSLDGENYSIDSFSKAKVGAIINKVTPFNEKIANLSDGLHFLSVYAQVFYFDSWLFEGNSSIEFNVDASSPAITQLSITNKTYNTQNTALSFNLNEKTSWIAYNLDNQGNITLQGNTTLTGLSYGSHSIVVYANDTLGNMGKTDNVSFEIKKIDFTSVIALSGIAVVIVIGVALGLLVYFKKYHKKTNK